MKNEQKNKVHRLTKEDFISLKIGDKLEPVSILDGMCGLSINDYPFEITKITDYYIENKKGQEIHITQCSYFKKAEKMNNIYMPIMNALTGKWFVGKTENNTIRLLEKEEILKACELLNATSVATK